ncbi:hypothetical protein KGQ96_01165 [Halomonas coralii]|nr:hypothetical protein [Modicisalibacter sp. MOD 31.J]MBZ9556675.1 hypothetical protein [Modicisalibacter sp. R2A 31.J]MBZ9574856.1 hypothetical protein [Modicisalibacter sp. MOD 31.J]
MLALSIASSLMHWPLWPAAILSWLATLRLARQLPRASRRQALALGGAGVVFWAVALVRGTPVTLLHALAINQTLLMMFAGVSFLSMAAPSVPTRADTTQRDSFWGTLFGVHLFGAVINLSALFLFADRMQHDRRLSRRQAMVLGRAFPAAAAWSPFFVAMGVALTYAPGLEFTALLPWGLACALALLTLVALDTLRVKGPFTGYPLEARALVLPGVLALAVLLLHTAWPTLGIPLIISIVSPLAALLLAPARERRSRLRHQLDHGLSRLMPQFALFLAAGVLSSGLSALLASWPEGPALPFTHFGHLQAWLTLGVIVALAFVGIHPLVGVTTLAPLLASLHPDPTLLGMVFLMGWALGTGSSPLSGSNLVLCSRYGVAPREMLRWNLPYAIVGWLACGAILGVRAALS